MQLVDRIYRATVGFILILFGRGDFKPYTNLAGDREIERGWILSNIGRGPGKLLDFGSGGYGGLSLAAAMSGYSVTAIDLNKIRWPYIEEKINFVQADILNYDFGENTFDVVTGCSVIEHIGLGGRYEKQRKESDGDIQAMERIGKWIKPGGQVIITIPVGQEGVFYPYHRVYGVKRLLKLFKYFQIAKQGFWQKEGRLWRKVSREKALLAPSSAKEYALGLFILTKK